MSIFPVINHKKLVFQEVFQLKYRLAYFLIYLKTTFNIN